MYVMTQFNSASQSAPQPDLQSQQFLRRWFRRGSAAQQTPTVLLVRGTADAVRKYRWLFQEWDVDEYLILSGDQLYRMDYSRFIEHHRRTGADLTVAALPSTPHKPRPGLMRTDGDGNILEFREKPKGDALRKC